MSLFRRMSIFPNRIKPPSTIIVKNYLPHNNMNPSDPSFLPFLCSMEPIYTRNTIGSDPIALCYSSFPIFYSLLLILFILMVFLFLGCGGGVPQYSKKSICYPIPNVSKKEVIEKDPITGEEWKFKKDYTFLHVPKTTFSKFLIPKIAKEDLSTDTLCGLASAFKHGVITEKEAIEKVTKIDFSLQAFQQFPNPIQGEGKVMKVANGLIAHDSPVRNE